jgi:hypothetical protein
MLFSWRWRPALPIAEESQERTIKI